MPFYFSLYSSLLLPLVLQGLIYGILLLGRGWQQDRLADRLLATLLLLLTLRPLNWMLGFAGWYDSHDIYTSIAFYVPWSWFLAYGPLAYLYFLSLTNRDFRLKWRHGWHFVPVLLDRLHNLANWVSDIVIDHWVNGQPLAYHYGTRGPRQETGFGELFSLFNFLTPISIFAYFGLTLWLYGRYRRYVQEHFSDTEPVDLSWLRNFVLAFLLTQLIFLGFQVADNLSLSGLSYIEKWYAYFAWGLIIYYLSIAGFHANARELTLLHFHPPAWRPFWQAKPSPTLPTTPPEPAAPEVPEAELAALVAHMETAKPYLHPGLTLKDLAQDMAVPQATLSKLINGALQQNFNDFINRYRVEAVQAAMQDPQMAHLSLLGLALACGFNSKATFNRVFKQHTGQTPSAWRRELEIPVDANA